MPPGQVQTIELVDCRSTPTDHSGLVADCTWNVTGSVGHWGHLHQRRNQYLANLTVEPDGGIWKITQLELLSEQRL